MFVYPCFFLVLQFSFIFLLFKFHSYFLDLFYFVLFYIFILFFIFFIPHFSFSLQLSFICFILHFCFIIYLSFILHLCSILPIRVFSLLALHFFVSFFVSSSLIFFILFLCFPCFAFSRFLIHLFVIDGFSSLSTCSGLSYYSFCSFYFISILSSCCDSNLLHPSQRPLLVLFSSETGRACREVRTVNFLDPSSSSSSLLSPPHSLFFALMSFCVSTVFLLDKIHDFILSPNTLNFSLFYSCSCFVFLFFYVRYIFLFTYG